MAQTKALAGATTEMLRSIVGEMSANSSKIHIGSILVNVVVRRNWEKIRENALTDQKNPKGAVKRKRSY